MLHLQKVPLIHFKNCVFYIICKWKLTFPVFFDKYVFYVIDRVRFSRECVPGDLFDMLTAAKQCLCGSACFRSFVHYLARLDLHRVAASVTGIDTTGRTHAPCEAFLCSKKCLDRYQLNPQATIWKR